MEFTLRDLETFQNQRLRVTYADFIARPEYQLTCDFFFGRVYSGLDSTRRDQIFEGFYQMINRVLGGDIIRCLRVMIDLQLLTRDLDLALHRKILEQGYPLPSP